VHSLTARRTSPANMVSVAPKHLGAWFTISLRVHLEPPRKIGALKGVHFPKLIDHYPVPYKYQP
jgi:hypothetical protein